METFIAIMKEGSFARASRKLGYAQSSLTAHIRLLEESLEVRLFEKRSRLNVPTDAARSFLPYAQEMLDISRNARNAMLATSGKMESKLTFAASEAALMPDVLKRFLEEYPQADLTLKVCACMEIPGLVSSGDADVGFYIGDAGAGMGKEPSLHLVASKKIESVLAAHAKNRKENLRSERFICARGNGLYRKMTEKAFELWGIEPKIVEAGSVPAIKELCMVGLGVALLPHVSVTRECSSGLLRTERWDPNYIPFQPELRVVIRKNSIPTPAVSELCARLKSALAEM